MLLFKFNFILFAILLSFNTNSFDDNSCLASSFDTSVMHKGWPFGLTVTKLKVKKENCLIEVEHEKLKFIKKKWMIDICRGPVHIKKGMGAIEVIKKGQKCSNKKKDSFCFESDEMKIIIQDDGLIFAEGEKEDLNSDHGKIYCSYLLLKSYLNREIIFSRKRNYKGVLLGKSQAFSTSSVSLPSAADEGLKVKKVHIPRPVMDEAPDIKKRGDDTSLEEKLSPVEIKKEVDDRTGSF